MLFFYIISTVLFITGLTGLWLQRRHMIGLLISLEVMFLAPVLLFTAAGQYTYDMTGQVWALIILCSAAAHTATALALIVMFYKTCGTIRVDFPAKLKG